MEGPKRKRNRLAGYDYSSCGAYFVTICTKDRLKILSKICRGGALLRPLLSDNNNHMNMVGHNNVFINHNMKSILYSFYFQFADITDWAEQSPASTNF